MCEPVLGVRTLGKRFGATEALRDVSVTFGSGEVHALIGENGAGKSTLGKVLAGIVAADTGEILLDGRRQDRWDARRARHAGVTMIAQELALVPGLSVAENIFLGREHHRFGVLRRDLRARFADLEQRCGFGLDPDRPVHTLRIADRQKVEVMRALSQDARLIVMDEPTSSLGGDDVAHLHELIAWLKSQQRSVVYVTHYLDAVMRTSDRVSVLRDGALVRTGETAQETKQTLVESMLGRPLDVAFPELPPVPRSDITPALETREMSTEGGVLGVSIVVRPGEIVGLAGLVGSGRTEILRALFGVDRVTEGEVLVDGDGRGLAYIPEDRHAEGLVLTRTVRENVTLPHLARFTRAGWVSRRLERRAVAPSLDRLDVVPATVDGDLATFSGGNQQKVLFAKWMLGDPHIVLLDEPTRGVDIGARARIYRVIADLARRGAAVLLVSSDLEEVVGLSHRIHLVRQGRLVGTADPRTVSPEELLFRLFGLDRPADRPTQAPP